MWYKKTTSARARPCIGLPARHLRRSSLRNGSSIRAGPPIICAIHDFNRSPSTWADSLIATRRIMLRSRNGFREIEKNFYFTTGMFREKEKREKTPQV